MKTAEIEIGKLYAIGEPRAQRWVRPGIVVGVGWKDRGSYVESSGRGARFVPGGSMIVVAHDHPDRGWTPDLVRPQCVLGEWEPWAAARKVAEDAAHARRLAEATAAQAALDRIDRVEDQARRVLGEDVWVVQESGWAPRPDHVVVKVDVIEALLARLESRTGVRSEA